MAVLVSEDEELVSSIEFTPGTIKSFEGQKWQELRLKLTSGTRIIELTGNKDVSGCLLCLEPKDELKVFLAALEDLANGTRERFSFEPSEPSFEFTIMALENVQEYEVECWIDAGNATTGIYRWDALGIRFHTVKKYLDAFIGQLKAELQPAKI